MSESETPAKFPPPIISQVVTLIDRSDIDKVEKALSKIEQEDPTFKFASDREEAEFKLAGMSHLHLSVCVDQLRQFTGSAMEIGPYEIIFKQRSTDDGYIQQQPFMAVEITILEKKEKVGTQFIAYKRGTVTSVTRPEKEAFPAMVTIAADIPLAEMENFLDELRGFNENTGNFSCSFKEYRDVAQD